MWATSLRVFALLLVALTASAQDYVVAGPRPRAGGGGGGGAVFNDCGDYDGVAMAYCQDFEATGGGNPSGESPAMTSSFGPNADYTGYVLDGAQSAQIVASGTLADASAWTGISGDTWIQWLYRYEGGAANFNPLIRFTIAGSSGYPQVVFSSISSPNYKMFMSCDAGSTFESSGTFAEDTDYIVKIRFNNSDETGELFVCAYDPGSDNPFDACTTSQGTCDGAGAAVSAPDGYNDVFYGSVWDDIFVSDYDLSD